MVTVKNLQISKQTGSDSHYASWSFSGGTVVSPGSIKAGSLVSIKSGATYYNGVSIPSWVMSDKWYIVQVTGDRAVLGKNQNGSHDIQSPINVSNLTGGSSGSSGSISVNTLDHYEVRWYYDSGDGIWFEGSSSTTTETHATYSAPGNANHILVSVTPVSKTYKVNNKDTSYWQGKKAQKTYSIAVDPPEDVSAPTVEVDKYKLTASLENITDARADKIEFQVYNGTSLVKSGLVTVVTCRASFSCNVSAGGDYRVRCRAVNLNGKSKIPGNWSSFSSSVKAVPSVPSKITVCRAASETSVYLEWTAVSTADTYDIEYATEKRYFDGSDQTTTATGIESNHYEKGGLQSGDEYFFRVRAVNAQGESGWSGIKSVVIGKKPSAPTTWSSTTTAIVGEEITLFWAHNSEDNSTQTYAQLELTIDDSLLNLTIENDRPDSEKDKVSSYVIKTAILYSVTKSGTTYTRTTNVLTSEPSGGTATMSTTTTGETVYSYTSGSTTKYYCKRATTYKEGAKIKWRVRTAGVTKTYGAWSILRSIDVYAPATLSLDVINKAGTSLSTVTKFPFYVSALAGPSSQAPIGYHLSISANSAYETVDNIGNTKNVNKGDAVYSKHFDISERLMVVFSAGNIDLENGIGYTVTCTASMNSGLTAESTATFTVDWDDTSYNPNAGISIDEDLLVAYIRPSCRNDSGSLVSDVTLSVYRREFDGTFTELATGLNNSKNVVVTDPHPSLDYARYRIVAVTKSTGAVSFNDLPGYPVGCKAIVIQWDEAWTEFDPSTGGTLMDKPWTGSMLKLPGNVDVSDAHDQDVSLIKYIGRSHPVAYYGTQRGETATWNVEIPKSDKDTLYAIRRLAAWMGDVYVREPSGSGYRASIKVSFSQKHCELTIPVSFNITRVEGGA
uniref:FN3 n=1 Tax=Siphoviridae sp. ct6tD39 TaxID=2826301 RepID=A0A8S5NBD8_9CAUD|nr:MAG TPA: FN3 [Siphoviridae sp. ct6tD39]